jgi:hypothetical protein
MLSLSPSLHVSVRDARYMKHLRSTGVVLGPQGRELQQYQFYQRATLIPCHEYVASIACRIQKAKGGPCSVGLYVYETGTVHYPLDEASTNGQSTDWAVLNGTYTPKTSH